MSDIPANTSTKATVEGLSGPDGLLFGTFSGRRGGTRRSRLDQGRARGWSDL